MNLILRVGNGFYKKSQIKKKNLFFLHLVFSCYYCFIDFKRQSEHSGLSPDTSNLVTSAHFLKYKVSKNLKSGCIALEKIKNSL